MFFVGAGVATPGMSGENKITPTISTVGSGYDCDWIVDDEGDGDAVTIQGAVDAAKDGDTICVYSGRYVEHVAIDKQLIIIGVDYELENGDDTGKPIIDGGGSGDVVYVSADGVSINGFIIQNSGSSGDYDKVDSGIQILSNNNVIKNNIIKNNQDGIELHNSCNNTISDNIFIDSFWIDLFFYYACKDNIISGNDFIKGVYIREANHNTFLNNTVNEKPLYYLEEDADNVINGGKEIGQIVLVSCANITVQNTEISNTGVGIELCDCENCIIVNNNVSNNINGIGLVSASNNIIRNSTISNNDVGIFAYSSVKNNHITANNITNNDFGIYADVRYTTFENNAIWYNSFINKKRNTDVAGVNQWDNGSKGNFWSDQLIRIDDDHDGICDNWYYVAWTGIDHYPLVTRIGFPPDPTPPEMKIEIPLEGYLHFNDQDPFPSPFEKTGIFALPWMNPLELRVRAEDEESGVISVSVYLDEVDYEIPWKTPPVVTLNQVPFSDLYKGKLTKWISGKHTLIFVAVNGYGNWTSEEMEITFFYFPRPAMTS